MLAGPGNRGFDIAVPIEKSEWLLIEARFSRPDVNVYVNIKTDTIGKRKSIFGTIGKLPGACDHYGWSFVFGSLC